MSKELKNITNTVMGKIHEGSIKMHSKTYFIIGSVLTFVGLVGSALSTIFIISLIRFFLRSHGPMSGYRLDQLLTSFPWWVAILAVLGLVIGIRLLRQYDFSYKIDFKIVLIIFVAVVIVSGWIIDMSGLNDVWFSRGLMPRGMRQYFQENNIQYGPRSDRI